MALTVVNALISLKDGASAPVNLTPGVTGVFTPGNNLIFSLQNTWGIQRAEMTLNAPRYPGIDKLTWEWRPGQYNGWQITLPENTLVDDTTDIAGLQIVVTVSDSLSSSYTAIYELESNLAGLGLGGTITATLDGAAAIGDALMTASNGADAARVTKWVAGSGFMPCGIALIVIGSLVIYAPIGQTVSGSTLGLGVGTSSWGIVNSSARVVRKKNPDPADVVAGWINTQGSLCPFDPWWPTSSDLIATHPPYFADNTGVVDASTAFRQMVADAEIPVGESNLNFSSKVCRIPKGKYLLSRPVHVNVESQKWCGEERLTTHVISDRHIGPMFYFAPDIGTFPRTFNALNGRAALQIRHQGQVQDEHWLPLSEYGSPKLHGKSSMTVEFRLAIQPTSSTDVTFILTSFGERFKNDTAWGYSECFGVFYVGAAGSPTTNSIGFTLTTTSGIQSVYTPTNSFPADGVFRLLEVNWSATQMRVYIDGVSQTLTVTGGATTITGTLIQRAWENMCLGEVFAFPLTLRRYSCADFDLWSLRISDIARNTSNYTPTPATKFSVDSNTVLGLLTADAATDADDVDGIFVRGWCRTATNSTAIFPAYWPHRRDNVAAIGGMAGVGMKDICLTSLYGTALDLNSTFDSVWDNITIIAANCGVRMDNNCFKSNMTNLYIGGSNSVPLAQKARYGITMTNAANVMYMANVMVSGFSYNYIASGAGDVSIGGSLYSTSADGHMLLINTLNFTMVNDSEMSDEASAATGFAPEFFLGLVNVEQSLFGNFQVSQAEGVLSIIKWEGDTPLPGGNACKHKLLTPYLSGNPVSPGTIEVTSTAPLGTITLDDSLLRSTIPVLTTGSPIGSRVILLPESRIESASTAMTDANFTMPRDTWIRNSHITITGTLTANRTVTVPPAEIGRRTIVNATTGGFTLNVIASGSVAAAIPVTTTPVTVLCNGTDAIRC